MKSSVLCWSVRPAIALISLLILTGTLRIEVLAQGSKTPVLHEFKRDKFERLLSISNDGKFILTAGTSRSERCGRLCGFLAVYESETGKLEAELLSAPAGSFMNGSFNGSTVRAIESQWDAVKKVSSLKAFEWDPLSGQKTDLNLPIEKGFSPLCFVSDSQIIGASREKTSDGQFRQWFQLLDNSGVHRIESPVFPYSPIMWCNETRAGKSYLVAQRTTPPAQIDSVYLSGKTARTNLYWISAESAVARRCCSVEGERLFGFSVSPAGNFIVTITGGIDVVGDATIGRDTGKGGEPQVRCFLNVIDSKAGTVVRRLPLSFPEQDARWIRPLASPFLPIPSSIHLLERIHTQIAEHVAISPDNSKIVIAYGFIEHNDGISCFGVYSMTDGHRLATLHADTYHAGLFRGALGDNLFATGAQLMGPVMFTPDSRKLVATGEHVWEWDVSGLQ